MGHDIRIRPIAFEQSIELFLKDIKIDVFIEVPVAYFPFVFFKRLGPFGGVDEPYSDLVDILTIDSDQGQEKPFWFEGTRNSLGRSFDVVDPVEGAEAYNCIELSQFQQLSVQISSEKMHSRLSSIFFSGDLYQINRNVVAIELLYLHPVGLEPFLDFVSLLAVAASNICD